MADSNSIDIPLLKVPFESLKRVSRDRKYVIDDVRSLIVTLSDLVDKQHSDQERAQLVKQLTERSIQLRHELDEKDRQEKIDAEHCQQRLQYLEKIGMPAKDHVLDWSRQRFTRILADHLLRSGFTDTASLLIQRTGLQGLTDSHIFEEAQPILSSLRQQNCGPALEWCQMNRVKLKKTRSKLEFKLRTQEFIELVRQGERLKAIQHSQEHLRSWAEVHPVEFQQVMCSLLFGQASEGNPYSSLFDQSQWSGIAELFYQELYRLHSMTQQSLLTIELQAGLSALKAPSATCRHESKEDPLHNKSFQILAKQLPYAKHMHSCLICALTKKMMNEHNPPMVLPSGIVYSEKAIQLHTKQGAFTDPTTGESYLVSDIRRAYIS